MESHLSFLGTEELSSLSEETSSKLNEYIDGVFTTKNQLATSLEKKSVELGEWSVYIYFAFL